MKTITLALTGASGMPYTMRLLELLLARRGVNVTRLEIFDTLGLPDDIYSNPRVEVLISRLRAKVLKADPDHPLPLRARHNIGYLFLAEE